MTDQEKLITLGNTDIQISSIGIGAWSWGDRFYWGYGRGYNQDDIKEAFDSSLASGINFFDTAETYGRGVSETLLGGLVDLSGNKVVIATKFMPYPWRLNKSSLLKALRKSLRRLGLNQVDLYQIHWPFPPVSIETWASGLADAVEHGLTKAVGVSNYNLNQMRRAQATLVKRGVLLASNQVEYSLINRKVEFNGLLSCCQGLGITLLAYSPLAQGLLTGKYTSKTPPPGIRGRRYSRRVLENIQPLIRLLQDIGRNHEGKTTAQVAINWLICKGVVPIPGAKNAKQAIENAGSLGWKLSNEEVDRLDQASRDIN